MCICLITGIGAFIYDAKNTYKISSDFVSIPLKFNHDDSSSTYNTGNAQVTVYGGFVKGFKNGVRYMVTGGAGAELLTKNSYYHYIIEKIDNSKSVTRVELPSPANTYIARYLATVQLFANSMYDENILKSYLKK